MLYEAMKIEIEKHFPSLRFTIDDDKKSISIPSNHEDVGSIEIQDDIDELTIIVGEFTHWHSIPYNEKTDDAELVGEIVTDVIEYLHDMFSDKIFMWGSATKGGGSRLIEEGFKANRKGYVWSGPFHS